MDGRNSPNFDRLSIKRLREIEDAAAGVGVLMWGNENDPGTKSHVSAFTQALADALETAARSLPIIAPVHSDVEIEAAIIAVGREQGGGLVVMPDAWMALHRAPIILAAARNNVPAIYYLSTYTTDGGLLSYGPHMVAPFRRAAFYVDHILRGEKPADLPVQFPAKFEMVVNLKKALGLTIPETLLATANEVIEWESRNAKRLDH